MPESLAERWPFSLPLTVAAAVLVLGLAGSAWQTWRWQAALQPGTAGARASELDHPPENTLPAILSANLFGAANNASTQRAATSMATSVGYTLRAAFAGSSGGAVIEASDGTAQWYPLGATLPGGVTLQEVHRDHVILDRNGALETLAFPSSAELAATAMVSASAGVGSAPLQEAQTQTSRAEPIPADASPEEKARIVRQRLEELRNRSRT